MAEGHGIPSPTLGALPLHLMVELFSHLPNPWLYACRFSTVSKKFNCIRVCYAQTLFRRVNFVGSTPYDVNDLWRLLVEDGPSRYTRMVLDFEVCDFELLHRQRAQYCSKCSVQQTRLLRRSLKLFSNLRDLDVSGISEPLDHWMLDSINKLMCLRTLSIRLNIHKFYNFDVAEVWRSICSRLSSLVLCIVVAERCDSIPPSWLSPATGNLKALKVINEKSRWHTMYPLIGPYSEKGPWAKRFQPAYFRKLIVAPHQVECFLQLTTLVIQLDLCLEGEDLLMVLSQCESITHLDVATAWEVSPMNVREGYLLKPLPLSFFLQFASCRQKFIRLNTQQWITNVPDSVLFNAVKSFKTLQEFFFQPRYRRVLVDRLSLQPGDNTPRENTDVLMQLVENCPQLKVLSIGEAGDQRCSCEAFHFPWFLSNGSVLHRFLKEFVQKEFGNIGTLSGLSQLDTLCLNNVALSSPTDILDIVRNCKFLRQLVLSNISSGPDLQRLPFLPEILRSGTNLTSVSILDEGMLFDDELLDSLSNLHSIKEIMLRTKQVVVRPLHVLSTLFSKLPGSAIFILVACRADSDAGVSELMDCERDLRPDCTVKVALRLLEFDHGVNAKYKTIDFFW